MRVALLKISDRTRLLLTKAQKHRALPMRWDNSAITNYWKSSVAAVGADNQMPLDEDQKEA
jgi:hypothetical protein